MIGIELIKDHVFGDPSFKTIEIIMFKATLSKAAQLADEPHQLHQSKVLISIERGVAFDFDFSDEITAF